MNLSAEDMDKKREFTSLPIQTGRADLPHPAFRLVASTMDWLRRQTKGTEIVRSAAQALAPLTGFPAVHCLAPTSLKAALRRTSALSLSALRWLFGFRSVSRMALPSYVPSLHGHYSLLRYYGRSDPSGLFGCRPPWFPDSRHLNFRPFCLQPSAVFCQTRSTPSALTALFCSGFASSLAGSPKPPTESSSLWASAWRPGVTDWSFTSSCSPPGDIAPMQLLSVTGPTVSARSRTFTSLFKCALRRTRARHSVRAVLCAAVKRSWRRQRAETCSQATCCRRLVGRAKPLLPARCR